MLHSDSMSGDLTQSTQKPDDGFDTAMPPGMPMRTIVFSSQKGGSGKTTLCGQLAVQADLMGAGPVAVVDTDPQGSLSDWWNARRSQTPLFVKTRVKYLASDLNELRGKGISLVFVDTPPAVTDIIEEIVNYADLVVIPIRPSPHDLRAVGATMDIIENQGKPVIFAINGATPQAQITSETAVALSQHGTVAPVTIHQRTDYATSMIDGGTVMEAWPESPSAEEITKLWYYISSRLRKMERRRIPLPFVGKDRRQSNQGHTHPQFAEVKPRFGRRLASGYRHIEKAF